MACLDCLNQRNFGLLIRVVKLGASWLVTHPVHERPDGLHQIARFVQRVIERPGGFRAPPLVLSGLDRGIVQAITTPALLGRRGCGKSEYADENGSKTQALHCAPLLLINARERRAVSYA
jgi:hypothetical protein